MEKHNLTFDERAADYVKRVSLNPETYKGDVETAYTVAASEQLDMDRQAYMPCINYLMGAIDELRRIIIGYSDKVDHRIAANKWENGADEQLGKIPYNLRMLPSGSFLQTKEESK